MSGETRGRTPSLRGESPPQLIGVYWQWDGPDTYAVNIFGGDLEVSFHSKSSVEDALGFLSTLPIDSYAKPDREIGGNSQMVIYTGHDPGEIMKATRKAMESDRYQGHVSLVAHVPRSQIRELFDQHLKGRRK